MYLKRKGVIEISNIQVGDAVIKGKINGDLHAMGTVEILKSGEIYGKITCRKLIVKKGGVFLRQCTDVECKPKIFINDVSVLFTLRANQFYPSILH